LRVVLPLPPRELSPNWTGHLRRMLAAKKRYRELARDAVAGHPLGWRVAMVYTTFYWPDKRRRDPDNAAASLKRAWDGMRLAGLLADDDKLTHWPPVMGLDPRRPRVEIAIREAANAAEGGA
jgi:Holliday junction resolvase RusA-like endonuclease